MKLGSMAEAFDLLASSSNSLSGLTLHQERFRLAVRKKKITERVVRHWNELAREMLEMFKKHVNMAPEEWLVINMVVVPGWWLDSIVKVSSNLSDSVIPLIDSSMIVQFSESSAPYCLFQNPMGMSEVGQSDPTFRAPYINVKALVVQYPGR